jgi:hypothetical protein
MKWLWWRSAPVTFFVSLFCTFSFARGCNADTVERASYIAVAWALVSLTIHRLVLITIDSEKK